MINRMGIEWYKYIKKQKITQEKRMQVQQSVSPRLQPKTIKLPKIALTKIFRIRSASKQKNEMGVDHRHDGARQSSHERYRSNSLKITNMSKNKNSIKDIAKKAQTQQDVGCHHSTDVGSCRVNSKVAAHSNVEAMEKEHERNMQKLQHIANIFDPKTIMKLGGKTSEHSQQDSNPKQNRIKQTKGQMRVNQYIFQGKYQHKSRNTANNRDVDEYWKKVNESLILAPCKTMENQVSKDLREIYQTLVTE